MIRFESGLTLTLILNIRIDGSKRLVVLECYGVLGQVCDYLGAGFLDGWLLEVPGSWLLVHYELLRVDVRIDCFLATRAVFEAVLDGLELAFDDFLINLLL